MGLKILGICVTLALALVVGASMLQGNYPDLFGDDSQQVYGLVMLAVISALVGGLWAFFNIRNRGVE